MNEDFDIDKLKTYSELQAEMESKQPEVVVEDEEEEVADEEEEVPEEEVEGDAPVEAAKAVTPKEAHAPWGKPGKVPKGIQDRFKKLTSKISELESQVANSGKPVVAQQETFDLGNPQELAKYIELQVELRSTAQANARDQQAKIQKEYDVLNETWTKNFEQAKADLPDYDEVLADSTAVLPRDTLRYIVGSDVGSYVSYTIAKNQDLQTEINSLTPEKRHEKVLEIEKTVRSFLKGRKPDASSVKPVSTTKVPLKVPGATVKKTGSQTQKLDLSSSSIEDLIAAQ